MKHILKVIIPLLILFLSGCKEEVVYHSKYAVVEVADNELLQEVTAKFPPGVSKGAKIDFYWIIYRHSKPFVRSEANHVTAIYDGKQAILSIYPWGDIMVNNSTEYSLMVEAVGYSKKGEEVSKRKVKKIACPIVPVVNELKLENREVHIEGKIVGYGVKSQVIEHGFYVGYTSMPDFGELNVEILKENFDQIVSTQPTSSFSSIHEFKALGWNIFGYAYCKTAQGYIYSDLETYYIHQAKITAFTNSNFTDLTHERATVSGNAYLADSEAGDFRIIERGFCYINTHVVTSGRMPNINDGRLILEGGEGEFSGTITGLAPAAAYKVAAYAINNLDQVFYAKTYTTLPMYGSEPFTPQCYMTRYYNDDPNVTGKIVLEGEIYSDRGYFASERGFCYTTNGSKPTISNNKIPSGSGLGIFSEVISDLPSGKYTFASYGINEAGVNYSATFYQVELK